MPQMVEGIDHSVHLNAEDSQSNDASRQVASQLFTLPPFPPPPLTPICLLVLFLERLSSTCHQVTTSGAASRKSIRKEEEKKGKKKSKVPLSAPIE